MSDPEPIKVGGTLTPRAEAEQWLRAYLDAAANVHAERPYSFPACDKYDCGSGPDTINDGDLMAPGLLNVAVDIRTFYALQQARPRIEAALRAVPHELRLEDATKDDVARYVGALYTVLDVERPHGAQTTLYSKVLHRKRPQFLALHDKWVRRCYVDLEGAPLGGRVRETYAEYMTVISLAIAEDIRTQKAVWDELAAQFAPNGAISNLRLVDIIAWHAGQRT